MNIKDNKHLLLIVYIFALLMASIGATFAYFTVLKTATVSPKKEVTSATTTSIIFDVGNPIAIFAIPDNFGIGMDNLTGDTYASTTLKVGTDKVSTTYYYSLYFDFTANTFVYTSGNRPEFVVNVYDPNGVEVTTIPGLDYVTYDGISGFDLTGKVGKFMIADKYAISTTSETTQRWNVKVTLVNFDTSQDVNMGNGLSGSIKIEPLYEEEG